jgi:UDP-2,3-diacylglucosamine pyrophosphatase LpxH
MQCDTLIVSDVHLGSSASLAADLLHLLKTSRFKRLILLGDIFQDLDFSRLTREQWRLIGHIRRLSNPKRGVEVVWVEGNHDAGIAEVMEHLIGVKVHQEYEWEWNGVKCLAIHGHQFDALWAKGVPLLGRVFTPLYLWAQKVDLLKKWLPRLLDKMHTHWERLDRKVCDGALRRAAHAGARHVFCGHTHQQWHEVRDNIEYWNTGDWVGERGGYITLMGKVEQREYEYRESRGPF